MSTKSSETTAHAHYDMDIDALRVKYARERDRRIRPDGASQYRSTTGQFGYYATDPYTQRTERDPLTDTVEVLVTGGGFGGLVTAARLREAGIESIRMVDEAGDFGGTWYWNRYPGIHCDIESYSYMPLLEEVGTVPNWRYAPGEEIRLHSVAIAEKYDLYRDTAFHTRVNELRWDEGARNWIVKTDRGDSMRARFVITSSGTLTAPKLPGIPGIETFRGHTFHTSRWDYGYTGGTPDGGLTGLRDKRVAVVGTGATGVQVVPHLGRDALELLVFQRTPSSVDVRDQRPTDPRWAESLRPGWQRERMDNFLQIVSGERVEVDLTDDGWTSTALLHRAVISGAIEESLSAEERSRIDELVDARKMTEIRRRVESVVEDPSTAELLKPWYRYMCKRPTFSDQYLQTFNRSNVTLVDTADHGGITRITEKAIVVGDTEYEVDCIVFATGFEVGKSGVLSGALPVHGRDETLSQAWDPQPRTLHGFMSHGFPNLLHLGALQNANAVNFAHILTEQAEHIAAILSVAYSRGIGVVEPTSEAEADWLVTLRDTARDNTAYLRDCTPGYYNNEGKPIVRAQSYSPGPIAFHKVLTDWRATRMTEVLEASS
ncbi:NAD(P)/FAD-dependent oxidoreductase [Rhodococcus sp. 14-2483-1-2]|uniref:flavin-containing monooxygenase n=1 Tax=Rhodococcus sp. 14-2483-1-2 TaxID=2023147 RepID=UPI000B9A9DF9|nr:NAD(P)/FAD-dependent oxidoreductase [Rhodococcus sp. 14-2483-1-2]OZF26128.1 monooxygenase [Rhodococcus sp. 14-2483-1-2]